MIVKNRVAHLECISVKVLINKSLIKVDIARLNKNKQIIRQLRDYKRFPA